MTTSVDAPQLGEMLRDEVEVYRAFAEKKYRERKDSGPIVRYWAFLLREDDINDGLSVGRTPTGAVKYLNTNEGYCSIKVEAITSLPDDLCVKADVSDAGHAFICNLPLRTISDDHYQKAMRIAKELARRAKVETCNPFTPLVSHRFFTNAVLDTTANLRELTAFAANIYIQSHLVDLSQHLVRVSSSS